MKRLAGPWLFALALTAGTLMFGAEAHAQADKSGAARTWPARPVRLIVPFAPGGATDATSRAIAKEVEGALGQPFVIDNRGGANGIIGYELVARAVPDGYMLMQTSIAFAISPAAECCCRPLCIDLN